MTSTCHRYHFWYPRSHSVRPGLWKPKSPGMYTVAVSMDPGERQEPVKNPVRSQALSGGTANVAKVFRLGDSVFRPTTAQSASVQHFLCHVRSAGIDWVPEPQTLGVDGRDSFSWIEGVAVTEPLSPWSATPELLIEVASRQRQLHEAARSYLPEHDVWAATAGDYFPAPALTGPDLVFCHNDLSTSNVIVDVEGADASVQGFIDFDYVRAVDPLFDIAVAARHWTPMTDERGEEWGLDDAGRVHRFGVFCDVHQLTRAERDTVVSYIVAFLRHARSNIVALAEAGRAGFVALIEGGYLASNDQTVAWITSHRSALNG